MNTFPGKIYQQDLHHWYHASSYPKWYYEKDSNTSWWGFYTALHNPPSEEKIVNFYHNYWWGGQWQLWAYIKRYNRLTSYDYYEHSYEGPHYHKYLGKIYQQDLHYWGHGRAWYNHPKWVYSKDPNGAWHLFYNAFHNLPSEKIVDICRYHPWSDQWQLWALYKEI